MRDTPRTLVILCAALCTSACTDAPGALTVPDTSSVPQTSPTQPESTDLDALGQTLADAFRIDLSDIDIVLDITPEGPLQGHAVLTFTMRPGQDKALFHFRPPLLDGPVQDVLQSVVLDGESLDPSDDSALRTIQIDGSSQEALELQRTLDADTVHTLAIDWTLPRGFPSQQTGWLQTLVDDTVGYGNETLWPTLNSPEEMARHTLTVRVHSSEPYVVTGSGDLTDAPDEPGVQIWQLDTVREVASYTVMLAVMPAVDVTVSTFEVDGVLVTLVSTEGPTVDAEAIVLTEETLSALADDFGPFPMPSMHILLVDWRDGMEYYGATTTGLSSLSHELVHMYFGCSTVGRTWRDTWMDEAINVWWERHGEIPPLLEGFHSNIVSGWPLLEPGFDTRAYAQGAAVVQAMAQALGGEQPMIEFLSDLHARRLFAPFTTDDLTEDLVTATGDEGLREDIALWLYTP